MKQHMPSMAVLLLTLEPAFRSEVYDMFCLMLGAWIVCLGRRTISRIWETLAKPNTATTQALFDCSVRPVGIGMRSVGCWPFRSWPAWCPAVKSGLLWMIPCATSVAPKWPLAASSWMRF